MAVLAKPSVSDLWIKFRTIKEKERKKERKSNQTNCFELYDDYITTSIPNLLFTFNVWNLYTNVITILG